MEMTINGKPLSLEARIIGVLLKRLGGSLEISESDLASVQGVMIRPSFNGRIEVQAHHYLHEPEFIELAPEGGVVSARDVQINGIPVQVAMTTNTGAWVIPASDQ